MLFRSATEHWQQNQGRIPTTLEYSFTVLPWVAALHAKALDKQAALDQVFQLAMTQLSPTYIVDLEKQIARFKAHKDPGAALLLQEEVNQTRNDHEYFAKLMLAGDAPTASPPPP